MEQVAEDDWDQHWADFGETSAQGPAVRYRTKLVLDLLAIGHDASAPVHVLDIGSGMGEFAAEFQMRFPGAAFTGLELSGTGVALATQRVPQA